ncbi:MAG TPA: hypothetical protein VLT32_10615 [Candidatus Sulfomarinibacteraceae bacterium]|nr:hypothetical protein [Candidatus Sulfomarinibacteraceae bacterium]
MPSAALGQDLPVLELGAVGAVAQDSIRRVFSSSQVVTDRTCS